VVESLFEVSVFQVGLPQLGVGRHQKEQVLLVDVDQKLAESELLDADLNHPVCVLGHREFVQGFVAFDCLQTVRLLNRHGTYLAHRKFGSPFRRTLDPRPSAPTPAVARCLLANPLSWQTG